jgi:hypothetical protein
MKAEGRALPEVAVLDFGRIQMVNRLCVGRGALR